MPDNKELLEACERIELWADGASYAENFTEFDLLGDAETVARALHECLIAASAAPIEGRVAEWIKPELARAREPLKGSGKCCVWPRSGKRKVEDGCLLDG